MGFDSEYPATEEFANGGFLYNLYYYNIAMTGKRFTYYVAWCFVDAALIAAGLAYNQNNSSLHGHTWDRVVAVYVWGVEETPSPPQKMVYWNHSVHIWLKNYIALRQVKPGQRLST